MTMTRAGMIEVCAMVAHEVNRGYCTSLGDDSQVPWTVATEDIKRSARIGVEAVLNGATFEELHESWSQTKLADGWSLGPFKDAVLKTHPCLVPYAELPPAQKLKDTLFANAVNSAWAACQVPPILF